MSAKKTQVTTLEFSDNKLLRALGGPHAKHLARIEHKLNVGIDMRGNLVAVEGKYRERAGAILRALYLRLMAGESVTMAEVDAEIRFTDEARVQAPGQEARMIATGATILNLRDVKHGGFKVVGDSPLKLFTVHIVDKGKPLYDYSK